MLFPSLRTALALVRVDDGAAIIKFLQGGAKGSIRVHGKVLMIPQTPFLRVAGPALWGFLKAYVDLLLTMKVASSGPLLFNFIRKKPVRAHSKTKTFHYSSISIGPFELLC